MKSTDSNSVELLRTEKQSLLLLQTYFQNEHREIRVEQAEPIPPRASTACDHETVTDDSNADVQALPAGKGQQEQQQPQLDKDRGQQQQQGQQQQAQAAQEQQLKRSAQHQRSVQPEEAVKFPASGVFYGVDSTSCEIGVSVTTLGYNFARVLTDSYS